MVTCIESCQSNFSKIRNELGNPICPGEWGTKAHIHQIYALLLLPLHAVNPNSRTQTMDPKLLKWCQTRKLVKIQPHIIRTRIHKSGLGLSVPLSVNIFSIAKRARVTLGGQCKASQKNWATGNILVTNFVLGVWGIGKNYVVYRKTRPMFERTVLLLLWLVAKYQSNTTL